MPDDAPRTWPVVDASINRIEIADGIWRVAQWGDVAHLEDAADDQD